MSLLTINVNEHTESKNGLTYLSWAWAWQKVLEIDPAATWEAHEWNGLPAMFLPDGSAMVKVSVTIKGDKKQCVLPVMNHKNQAIPNPNAFQVNTAIMRCLAKCVGMHGLGLYIYAGEDVPPLDTEKLDALASEMVMLHQEQHDMEAVRLWYASKEIQTSNEAREYLWLSLRDYSALRSAIKANKPEQKQAA